jgi:tRNA threonylcarbamoyladenosine biosynthesis protein TsaE
MKKFILHRVEDWKHVVQAILPELKPGVILTLSGPLGAGKTTFVQALAEALGSKSRPRSPSFALLRSYRLKNDFGLDALIHFDAYRIESGSDGAVYGLDEHADEASNLLVIEWPEKLVDFLSGLDRRKIQVKIETDPKDDTRRVTVLS